MKYIIFLCILIAIYYQLYKRYPEIFTPKYHFYFTVFTVCYLMLYYFMSFQKRFMYDVLKSVKEVDEKPLYDRYSHLYKQNQMEGLRYNLAMKQNWRCMSCQNPILQKDIHEHKIHYITPLQYGGKNNVNNLGIKCLTCSNFSPY